MNITLVTGNGNKLKELQSIAPAGLQLKSQDIDLPEIQSLDLHEIVEDKVKKAYAVVQGPVIVEDVSTGLDDFDGLPGPFYKFFSLKRGNEVLLELAKISSNKVTVRCLAAYYDGENLLYGEGILRGKVVEPRGENGFGFDPVIVPEGKTRTMAEMLSDQKNELSHRGQAFRNLLAKIEQLKS
jgi:non-canonical purine NTP pyrophosphatase (RdgB/HAM1 family)